MAYTTRCKGAIVLSLKQFWFLMQFRNRIVSVDECTSEEKEMIDYFLSLEYVEAITDGSRWENFTPYRRITQKGLAAIANKKGVLLSTGLSVIAIIISLATFALSLCGAI